jgi:glycosyltransferase involved in cell wall biosynthesis
VIFTGFVADEELDILYANAGLYVFPSLCEGFGLPPLEAMSYGVPAVSSNATCLPEILGEAAVYFNALDPVDMAKKINLVLSDGGLRQELTKRGFEQIKKYSWRKMAEETLKIYRQVC